MSDHKDLVQDLTTLNQIMERLNEAVDVRQALDFALTRLVELMGLETGWIFLKDPESQNRWAGKGYVLAAHHNLPEALKPNRARAWKGGCDCQTLCGKGELTAAYNEVRCSRLRQAPGERNDLTVHASAPLRSGDEVLGILNVAGPDWDAFTPEALILLANVGSQMGIALERARLFELVQEHHLQEQIALLQLSNKLLGLSSLEEIMDFLVEEARELLNADACAIVLPSEDHLNHVEFCAASGWYDDPVAAGRLIPFAGSGTGVAMETQQPLTVEDYQTYDPTPWTAEWILAEMFRGHAVVPLIAAGESIGAMMIDTREPHQFTEGELRFLQLMANQAAIAIEKARLHQEEITRQRLEEELAVGRQIQNSLLPETVPHIPGWEFAAIYQPARVVGGDFYDFIRSTNGLGHLDILIADVADKGVPAALFMAMSRTTIRTAAFSGRTPSAVLSRANELILNDSHHSKLFLSAFYATLNTETGRVTYANAGHNWPLWYRAATGACYELEADGVVLGVIPDIALEERVIHMRPGDMLIFYTDGVTESMNPEEKLFGEARFEAAILAATEDGAQAVLDSVLAAIRAFTDDAPQYDDFTLLVIKWVG